MMARLSATCRQVTALCSDILWTAETSSRKAAAAVETLLKFKVNYGCFSSKFENVTFRSTDEFI